jgi:hypothetical protein
MIDNFNKTESQYFYNTISLNDIEWEAENNKAIAMQETIKKIFWANPEKEISGWQMQQYLEEKQKKRINILSVRRCMSNLKNELFLYKTLNMRTGSEGKPEHYYIKYENRPKTEKIEPGKSVGEFAKSLVQKNLFD